MRALEGEDFEDEVPQKDVDGTRGNMLGEKLLDGEQHATISIRSSRIEGSLPDVNIVTILTVKGMEQTVTFPANVTLTDDSFVASGELEIMHEGLGLSPFTAMGGRIERSRPAGSQIRDCRHAPLMRHSQSAIKQRNTDLIKKRG